MESIIRYPNEWNLFNSLWYEGERLATFFALPINMAFAYELAEDGFYQEDEYVSACMFCCGKIPFEELKDGITSPREKHKRYFGDCPFVLGEVTPNVPFRQGSILNKIVSKESKFRIIEEKEDDCGTLDNKLWICSRYANDPCWQKIKRLGLEEYWKPDRRLYVSYESRVHTFISWPQTNSQTPEVMAEAGFFYFNVDDDVRCFYCNLGLRNWNPEDDPFVEHARWNPKCHYVILRRGDDFINKVLRERPPYIQFWADETALFTRRATDLSDKDFDQLLELDIMKEIIKMGWSQDKAESALVQRICQTGHPFPSLKSATEAVIYGSNEKPSCSSSDEIERMGDYQETNLYSDEDMDISFVRSRELPKNYLSMSNVQTAAAIVPKRVPAWKKRVRKLIKKTSIFRSPGSDSDINKRYDQDYRRDSLTLLHGALRVEPSDKMTSIASFELENFHRNAERSSEEAFKNNYIPYSPPDMSLRVEPSEKMTPVVSFELKDFYRDLDSSSENTFKNNYILFSPPDVTHIVEPSDKRTSVASFELKDLNRDSDRGSNDIFNNFDDYFLPSSPSVSVYHSLENGHGQLTFGSCKEIGTSFFSSFKMEDVGPDDKANRNNICQICEDQDVETAFSPCLHRVACGSCSLMQKSCPVCKSFVSFVVFDF